MKYSTPEAFILELLQPAKDLEAKYRIPFELTIAQGALESGWGRSAIGNNIFGIKADKSWKGKTQLVVTTEYLKTNTVVFPEIILIQKTTTGTYKYTVKDYFRDYDSLTECLEDHAQFLIVNKRYAKAFNCTTAEDFAKEVAKAGYATDPNYAKTLCEVINSVRKRLPK